MSLPSKSFVSNSAHDQFFEVAQTMRNLADTLAGFAINPAPEKINQISADIRKIGWNSLFISSLLDELIRKTKHSNPFEFESPKDDPLEQIDGLFTAVIYLSKTVSMLKELMRGTDDLEREMLLDQLRCLGIKVEELADECHKF